VTLWKKLSTLRALSLMVCGGIAPLAMSAPTFAQHAGGGHVWRGVHGGFSGGYHGGYGGYRGGYGGYRGGYGGYPGGYGVARRLRLAGRLRWYGPVGLGRPRVGLYFANSALYYSTVWWDGVPYYYADNTYYRWNGTVNQLRNV